MLINKDMLIGELIQVDDCIAPILIWSWHALLRMPIFSGRVFRGSLHGSWN